MTKKNEKIISICCLMLTLIMTVLLIVKLETNFTEFPFRTILSIFSLVLALICLFVFIVKVILLAKTSFKMDKGLKYKKFKMQRRASF